MNKAKLHLHVTLKWTKRLNISNKNLPSHHKVNCNCRQHNSSNTAHNNYSYKEILWLLIFYRSIRMPFNIPPLKVQTNHCCYYFVHSGFLPIKNSEARNHVHGKQQKLYFCCCIQPFLQPHWTYICKGSCSAVYQYYLP